MPTSRRTFDGTLRHPARSRPPIPPIDIVEQVASTFPGFVSAAVHRTTDGTRVFNYLQWESAEHLAAMQRSPEFQAIGRRFAGLIEFEPHQCEVVYVG